MTDLIAQINDKFAKRGLLPNPNRITSLEMTPEGLAVGMDGEIDIDSVDAQALFDYMQSDKFISDGFFDILDWVIEANA